MWECAQTALVNVPGDSSDAIPSLDFIRSQRRKVSSENIKDSILNKLKRALIPFCTDPDSVPAPQLLFSLISQICDKGLQENIDNSLTCSHETVRRELCAMLQQEPPTEHLSAEKKFIEITFCWALTEALRTVDLNRNAATVHLYVLEVVDDCHLIFDVLDNKDQHVSLVPYAPHFVVVAQGKHAGVMLMTLSLPAEKNKISSELFLTNVSPIQDKFAAVIRASKEVTRVEQLLEEGKCDEKRFDEAKAHYNLLVCNQEGLICTIGADDPVMPERLTASVLVDAFGENSTNSVPLLNQFLIRPPPEEPREEEYFHDMTRHLSNQERQKLLHDIVKEGNVELRNVDNAEDLIKEFADIIFTGLGLEMTECQLNIILSVLLKKSVTVIKGIPGSAKSTTLAVSILMTLYTSKKPRILVLTPTNVASDVLFEKVMKAALALKERVLEEIK